MARKENVFHSFKEFGEAFRKENRMSEKWKNSFSDSITSSTNQEFTKDDFKSLSSFTL